MRYKGNLSQIRIVVFALLVLFFTYSAQAQESAHSAGGDVSSSIGSVAFSIGQVVYSSYSLGVGTESQGVQQRYDLGVVSTFRLLLTIKRLKLAGKSPQRMY